jgi:predicted enzyme related to lactoylglutathione lyase
MAERSDQTSAVDRNRSELGLFMTVVKVGDWPAAVAWYKEVLRMSVALMDSANQFALFSAGGGRLALEAAKRGPLSDGPGRFRLVFQVGDICGERERLSALGVPVEGPFDNHEEGFREIRFHDPEGNAITLFCWVVRGENVTTQED